MSARIPEGIGAPTDELGEWILDQAAVARFLDAASGTYGEGYVRISLTVPIGPAR